MSLYGKDMLAVGIGAVVLILLIAAIALCIHLIRSSRLKKQLEREYGPRKN